MKNASKAGPLHRSWCHSTERPPPSGGSARPPASHGKRDPCWRALRVALRLGSAPMAVTAGDVLRFHDGSEFTVVKSAADTRGEALELEIFFPPTTENVPRHVHPEQAETYEVIEGAFKVLVGSDWQELGPGQSATV